MALESVIDCDLLLLPFYSPFIFNELRVDEKTLMIETVKKKLLANLNELK
jgi:hypothetical protein